MRIAIIDSGIHAAHPHIGGVAGGIAIGEDGRRGDDWIDRIGHGTAVAAAIKEKAPDAELYAVKVFERALSTRIGNLVGAIDWAADSGMHVANLSLGTSRREHEPALRAAVERAVSRRLLIVAAHDDEGVLYLPGGLSGVLGVRVDWTCPRDAYLVEEEQGRLLFRASGWPRPIPGVPPSRNLSGISFAVANMTGLAARALRDRPGDSIDEVIRALAESGRERRQAPESVDFTGKV